MGVSRIGWGPPGPGSRTSRFSLSARRRILFPVLVLIAGVFLFRNQELPERGPMLWRGAGFLLTIATSSGLATLHFDPRDMRETAGGILGQLVGRGLEHGLGMLGATVLLLVLWLAAVSLATGVSWVAIMDRVGRVVYAGVVELNIRVNQFRIWLEGRRAKQQREEVVAKVRAKPKAAAPRIEPTIEKVEVSARAERERERDRQVPLFEPPASTELPALSLLDDPPPKTAATPPRRSRRCRGSSRSSCKDFGIEAEVVAVHPGPVVTRFELQPAPGVKVSQISNLAKDLARALVDRERARGRSHSRQVVRWASRSRTRSARWSRSARSSSRKPTTSSKSPLALALGKDIGGSPVVADLARMPHLLVARHDGLGQVGRASTRWCCRCCTRRTPEHVRLIMIDPKMLELSVYEGIPHLLAPVVTDMKQAANALRWCVAEMERRYQLMAAARRAQPRRLQPKVQGRERRRQADPRSAR